MHVMVLIMPTWKDAAADIIPGEPQVYSTLMLDIHKLLLIAV
jgi:hypothetical protein